LAARGSISDSIHDRTTAGVRQEERTDKQNIGIPIKKNSLLINYYGSCASHLISIIGDN
jgi:hypothetical protein